MFDIDDPLAPARDALHALTGDDLAGAPAATLSDRVLALAELADRVRAELVRTVGQWDARQAWAADGAVTGVSWLAARAPMTRREAALLVRTARVARDHEQVSKVLAAGDLSVSHAESLARAERDRGEIFGDHADGLVDLAPTLTPTDFVTAMKHWSYAADDALARRDPYERFEHRHLSLAPSFSGGAHVNGFMDPEGAAILGSCLDAYTEGPDPAEVLGPRRSAAQRRADALVQIARVALEHTGHGLGRPPVGIDAVFDVSRSADGIARHELDGHAAAAVIVERLCCDGAIARVVMRGESEVLDLGRRTRVVSDAQRRALRRRDRHCQFPGCDRPARWTDAHHLVHWVRGGSTDLDNLVLLCRRHHVLCHEGGWQLLRQPDGNITAAPPRSVASAVFDTRGPPGCKVA